VTDSWVVAIWAGGGGAPCTAVTWPN